MLKTQKSFLRRRPPYSEAAKRAAADAEKLSAADKKAEQVARREQEMADKKAAAEAAKVRRCRLTSC